MALSLEKKNIVFLLLAVSTLLTYLPFAQACDPIPGVVVSGWSSDYPAAADACPAAQSQANLQCVERGGSYASCPVVGVPTQAADGTWGCELSGCSCWKKCKSMADPVLAK